MGRRTSSITYDDVVEKLDTLENIDGYSPVMNSTVYLKNKDKESYTTSCVGSNENYATVQDKTIQEGRFLTSFDISGKMNVVVIGPYIKNEIFGDEDAIGNYIKINGQKFKVVGILTETASSEEGSADDMIIIVSKST